MITTFQQGIVYYPTSSGIQQFLTASGANVNLYIPDQTRVDVTFAHGSSNYLLTETATVLSAWQSVPTNVDVWLYWDINIKTGLRTFGFTLVAPTFGTIRPTTPVEDQHWFDTAAGYHYVYHSNVWIRKIRVFAGKVANQIFSPINGGITYSGSQVGLSNSTVDVSYILFDDLGKPIIRSNGEFITLASQMFARGSAVNQVKLDANVITAVADEPINKFSAVKLYTFDKIRLCNYADVRDNVVSICVDDLGPDQLGRIITQGVVTNPAWNWPTVGDYIWVNAAGGLTNVDPHVVDILTYPVSNPPIARVLSSISILMDQALANRAQDGVDGADGAPGADGTDGADGIVEPATTASLGSSRLSVSPVNSASPIVVGDNDPRMTNSRTPVAHIHAIADVTGLQAALTGKLNSTGGTVTGAIILPQESNNPNPLQASTIHYVETALSTQSKQQYDLNFYSSGFISEPNQIIGVFVSNRIQTLLSSTATTPSDFGAGTRVAQHKAVSMVQSGAGAVVDIVLVHNELETDVGTIVIAPYSRTHTVNIPINRTIASGDVVYIRTRSTVDTAVKDVAITLMSEVNIRYKPAVV